MLPCGMLGGVADGTPSPNNLFNESKGHRVPVIFKHGQCFSAGRIFAACPRPYILLRMPFDQEGLSPCSALGGGAESLSGLQQTLFQNHIFPHLNCLLSLVY